MGGEGIGKNLMEKMPTFWPVFTDGVLPKEKKRKERKKEKQQEKLLNSFRFVQRS